MRPVADVQRPARAVRVRGIADRKVGTGGDVREIQGVAGSKSGNGAGKVFA